MQNSEKTSPISAPKWMNFSSVTFPILTIKDPQIDVFDAKLLRVYDHKRFGDVFMVKDWKING